MATKHKKRSSGKSRKASTRKSSRKSKRKKAPAGKLRKPSGKKTASRIAAARHKRRRPRARIRGKREDVGSIVFEPAGMGSRSGGQSGDLQGLSNLSRADSESVDELLEEGNAFEAEVVKGVEDVRDADEGEVRTHELPEDDVPKEYLERDE